MKDKIANLLGEVLVAEILKAAKVRGIEDPYQLGLDAALAELPKNAKDEVIAAEDDIVDRAAIRTQQIVGLIPGYKKPEVEEVVETPTPAEPAPEAAAPSKASRKGSSASAPVDPPSAPAVPPVSETPAS